MPDPWERMAWVGTVARPHGNRGRVVVNPETDFPSRRFGVGAVMHARVADAVESLVVGDMRMQQGRPIVGFRGVESIEAAERLRNAQLRVPTEQLLELPAGTYYWHELIGCRVAMRDGREIGEVERVDGTLERSWLVVVRPGRRGEVARGRADVADEVLVPLTEAVCARIDPSDRRIEIDPPPGLLELNVRRSGSGHRHAGGMGSS